MSTRSGKPAPGAPKPPAIKTRDGVRDFSGYAQAAGAGSAIKRALEERTDEAKPSHGLDVVLPTLLLVTGLPLAGILAIWFFGFPGGLALFAGLLAIQLFVFTPLLFGSVCLIAKWFEHPLGLLPTVLFKTVAMTLGPAAVGDVLFAAVLSEIPFDWEALAAGFGFYLVLTGPVAALMFGLRLPDTATLVGLTFIPRVVVGYAIAAAFPKLLP